MAGEPFHMIKVAAAGVVMEIAINDIPVADGDYRSPTRASERIDASAMTGPNRLAVTIRSTVGREPRVDVKLVRSAFEGNPKDAVELAAFKWEGAPPPPVNHQESIPLTGIPAWSWVGAPSTSPTAFDRADIARVIGDLASALAARNIDRALELQRVMLDEQAMARGDAPGAMDSSYRDFLAERTGAPGWSARAVPTSDLVFRPLAGGRMLRVEGPNGAPSVVTTSSAGGYAVAPCVSRLSGVWTIVRC